jgi:hypothetical protein
MKRKVDYQRAWLAKSGVKRIEVCLPVDVVEEMDKLARRKDERGRNYGRAKVIQDWRNKAISVDPLSPKVAQAFYRLQDILITAFDERHPPKAVLDALHELHQALTAIETENTALHNELDETKTLLEELEEEYEAPFLQAVDQARHEEATKTETASDPHVDTANPKPGS